MMKFSVLFASYYISSQSSMFLGFGRIGFADSQLGNPGWACIPYYSRWKTGQMPWTDFADDFLGFGLPVGSPSLGELLNQAKDNLHAPWLGFTAFFVIAIMLSLLVFIGEGVRDAFDPRKVQG